MSGRTQRRNHLPVLCASDALLDEICSSGINKSSTPKAHLVLHALEMDEEIAVVLFSHLDLLEDVGPQWLTAWHKHHPRL